MGLKILAAGASAVVIAMMAFAAQPADAQQTKKKTVANQSRVVVASRNRSRIRFRHRIRDRERHRIGVRIGYGVGNGVGLGLWIGLAMH